MGDFVTLTVNSTHFYLINCRGGKLLIDAGWEMKQFANQLKVHKIAWPEIRYVMFTHHHPDHAGLVQDVKDHSGSKLIIHSKQIPYLEDLRTFFEKKGGYNPIRVEEGDLVSPSRAALEAIGIKGEIIETPGHSDDSISLVLDSGEAFIGDLMPPDYAYGEGYEATLESWRKLLARGAQVFYHSHVDAFPAERIRRIIAT